MQVQAILLQPQQHEEGGGYEEEEAEAETGAASAATALLERAGQRLEGLRVRLSLPSPAVVGVRPPFIQSLLDSLPSALEPDQVLRALEWLDANREGVAALPCLPSERVGGEAMAAAVFGFSSAEDTPLLRGVDSGGDGGGDGLPS